jgi:hypothetical protein
MATTITTKRNDYLEITKARHLGEYRIGLEFNDGRRRIVDFAQFLKKARNPMFTKYRRVKQFRSFHIEHGDLMWGDFEMIFPIADLHRGEI